MISGESSNWFPKKKKGSSLVLNHYEIRVMVLGREKKKGQKEKGKRVKSGFESLSKKKGQVWF